MVRDPPGGRLLRHELNSRHCGLGAQVLVSCRPRAITTETKHHPEFAAGYHEQCEETSPKAVSAGEAQRPIRFHVPTIATVWAWVLIDKLCLGIGLSNEAAAIAVNGETRFRAKTI